MYLLGFFFCFYKETRADVHTMFEVDGSLQLGFGLVCIVAEEVTLCLTALQQNHPSLPPPRLEENVRSLLRRGLGQPALMYHREGHASSS